MTDLPSISIEQQAVINALKEGNNVVCNGAPGCGKSTTICWIAKTHPDVNICFFTYNRKLCCETRKRAVELEIKNLTINTYHSFCVRYYDRECFTDTGIINILKPENKNKKKLADYMFDMIIIDEAQDMTPLYFELICKVVKDNKNKCQFCILGDEYQSIYQFNNADARYITLAEKIFKFNDLPWSSLKLSTSFRVTYEIADFVNKCMLRGQNKIVATKPGPQVRYIICDTFGNAYASKYGSKYDNKTDTKYNAGNRIYVEIDMYLNKYKPEDIFIIAPSVKSEGSPIRLLANYISDTKKIPIFVPTSNEEKLDEDVLKGKLVFSSYHQVKGLERKAIIVFGFDDSYFEIFKKDNNPFECPNEMYVACTRSKESMTVFHHYTNNYLPFLDLNAIRSTCYYEEEKLKLAKKGNKITTIAVTKLINHLPVSVINKAYSYFDTKLYQKSTSLVDIDIKTKQNKLYENVSEITGTAIPAYFEYKLLNKMTIYDHMFNSKKLVTMCKNDKHNNSDSDDDNVLSGNIFNRLNKGEKIEKKQSSSSVNPDDIELENITPSQLLYVANKYVSDVSGFSFKMNQITDYSWLSQKNLEKCVSRLEKYISNDAEFEVEVAHKNDNELFGKKLSGHIDCICKNKMWEFKCVKTLEKEHFIQLALYAYLYQFLDKKETTISLKDDKIKELDKYYDNLAKKVTHEKGDEIVFANSSTGGNAIITLVKSTYILARFENDEIKLSKKDIKENITQKNKLNEKKLKDVETISNFYKKNQDANLTVAKEMRYFLFNIITNEIYEIYTDEQRLSEMVKHLVYHKYYRGAVVDDDTFVTTSVDSVSAFA